MYEANIAAFLFKSFFIIAIKETFLAPSDDNQTRKYDTEFSNHHHPLSTLRSYGLSHSKIKW